VYILLMLMALGGIRWKMTRCIEHFPVLLATTAPGWIHPFRSQGIAITPSQSY
jgi:hypothetical protein